MSASIPVDELAPAMPFDALVVAIADAELRYTCRHCSAEEVLADLGPAPMSAPELLRGLERHLEQRHHLGTFDIRFWDGREAAAESRARAEELTRAQRGDAQISEQRGSASPLLNHGGTR